MVLIRLVVARAAASAFGVMLIFTIEPSYAVTDVLTSALVRAEDFGLEAQSPYQDTARLGDETRVVHEAIGQVLTYEATLNAATDGSLTAVFELPAEARAAPRPIFFPWMDAGNHGVRLGDWKLIRPASGAVELYDLGRDPSEQLNLSTQEPERLAEADPQSDTDRELAAGLCSTRSESLMAAACALVLVAHSGLASSMARSLLMLLMLLLLLPLMPIPVAAQTCPDFFAPITTGVVQDPAIDEASGLAASALNPGVFWVHNDSGDAPRVFAMRADGTVLARYDLTGASATDWEDMARGPGPVPGADYLYLADIGDNSAARSFITVWRVPEPVVDPNTIGAELELAGAVALEMEYPAGAHDAETLLSDPLTGDLFVVTKCRSSAGCTNGVSRVFRYPFPHQDGIRVTLTEVATIPFSGPEFLHSATAGDVSSSGDRIAVRTYTQALLWRREPGDTIADALATTPCPIAVPPEIQGETLAFSLDGASYSSVSEFASQPIRRIDEAFADQTILGKALVVKDSSEGTDETRRRIVVSARESDSPESIVGSPHAAGAVLDIIANGANPSAQTFVLLAGDDSSGTSFWRDLGPTGFRYSDPNGEQGPVKKVVFRKSGSGSFTLKVIVTGKNGSLAVLPPTPGRDGYATLRFPGGDRYCVEYGPGSVARNAGAKLWRMKRPTTEGCPP